MFSKGWKKLFIRAAIIGAVLVLIGVLCCFVINHNLARCGSVAQYRNIVSAAKERVDGQIGGSLTWELESYNLNGVKVFITNLCLIIRPLMFVIGAISLIVALALLILHPTAREMKKAEAFCAPYLKLAHVKGTKGRRVVMNALSVVGQCLILVVFAIFGLFGELISRLRHNPRTAH